MRILIACNHCKRQYDASGRRVGTRLRCRCGETMTVEPPQGHDAAVVRCSACGAPREQDLAQCNYCGSGFTLHERDLHTVCPRCLSRVSDRAKFCHHCGVEMTADTVAGDETPLQCPVCPDRPHLMNRNLGSEKVAVMECQQCVGLWLSLGSFGKIADRAAKSSSVSQKPKRVPPPVKQVSGPRRTGSMYRPCVYCDQFMTRRQYGRSSGVIVDVCREHGVWFDSEELPNILSWIRSGGGVHPLHSKRRLARQDRQLKEKPLTAGALSIATNHFYEPHDDLISGALSMLRGIFD